MGSERWRLIEECFDAALPLSSVERERFLARIGDAQVRVEVASLLRVSNASAAFLEAQPASSETSASANGSLPAGARVGAWRIVRLVGHGGMGEVYEAERADGQFEQRAALKLTRRDSTLLLDRFNAERQILARLDHPGIARLLDGGVAADGRPYAVMEFVDGESIVRYCQVNRVTLPGRLELFTQICDAVGHAHRNLIVHRDIKPGNVMVRPDGRVRLLDFGIAKPLDGGVAPDGSATRATGLLLTPDYAAPEQLTGEPVTTATDIYALGILLFELLVGGRPWNTQNRPLAQLVSAVLDEPAPRVSDAAKAAAEPPLPPRRLEGDLDAIVAKCLRREPQQRYATVNALKNDVEGSLRGDPISAREDARLYVLRRLVRRYRWAAASVAAIIIILGVGIAATAWQAQRASREASRAAATRDFLIGVFRESDPQIARDRAPGEVTAKELLDRSVQRIESEFVGDPETQLELLGVASEIYGFWLDEPRFHDLLEKRTRLARQHFGEAHPVVIESIVLNAWGSIYTQDYSVAQRLLENADKLIRRGGHDRSLLRAHWWQAQAEALKSSDPRARGQALDNAVNLFARLAPEDAGYAIALANSAVAHFVREDYAAAAERNRTAIDVFLRAKNRSDIDLAATYANLARSLQESGEFEKAEQAYEQSASLVRRTLGEHHGAYWQPRADHARLVHMRGERERAHRMFDALFEVITPGWKTTIDDVMAREYYAERLAAEGRAAEAIPLLEKAERTYMERPLREYDLRRMRQTLGDAYDRAGRFEDARRTLQTARDERMQKDAPDSIAVLAVRERYARFLLERGETDAALAELREIVRAGKERTVYPLALAHAALAQAAIARGDSAVALSESRIALDMFERLTGLYDVRIGPRLWRVHAQALALGGDAKGAAAWDARAAEASRRYDGSS